MATPEGPAYVACAAAESLDSLESGMQNSFPSGSVSTTHGCSRCLTSILLAPILRRRSTSRVWSSG